MARLIKVLAVVLVAGFLAGNVLADSFGKNITIPDKVYTANTGWYGQQEDNEVEPGSVSDQKWDLEAFFLNGNILSAVGGFDFSNGVEDPYTLKMITTGDVFIDVDGDAQYGPKNDNTGVTPALGGRFGYDYVFDLTFGSGGNGGYILYKLSDNTVTTTVSYGINQESNPVSYVSGGYEPAKNTFTYGSFLVNNETHYYLTGLDMSFLNGADFISHLTISCGNDNLMGSPAPEPATLLLLGSGLIGIATAGRKKIGKRS